MIGTTMSRLRRGMAAIGAATMLVGALAPATALADPHVDPGSSTNDKAVAGTATSSTEVWLDVTDKGAVSMSVTAPLRIHLAVEKDSNLPTADQPANGVYEFAVPSSNAARIVNNGSTKVRLASYTVTGAGVAGRKKVSDGTTDETKNGFFKSGTAAADMTVEAANRNGDASVIEEGAAAANTYWLQALVAGTPTTLDLAVSNDGLSADSADLLMGPNDESGNALRSYLPLNLSGMICDPDGDTVRGFAAEGGAKLSTIVWTFKKVD